MYETLRSLLFRLDAETAHGMTLRGLNLLQRLQLASRLAAPAANLPVRAFGLDFPNPVGLAAGLDKDGACIDALGALGFGFVEIGTVTPRPQTGNPRPRLFRLPDQDAIINRMGFNNAGLDRVIRNVERADFDGIVGINIGRNKDTPNEDATDDYLTGLRRAYPVASYITVNVSSPNTAGLRDLQHGDALARFLDTLLDERAQLATRYGRHKPLLLKISPDLEFDALNTMADTLQQRDIDGVICTNTTVDRPGLDTVAGADETGGLSGAPLFDPATRVLAAMSQRLPDSMPLIGVGGIIDPEQAGQKRQAGATLVQLYSGLIYRGPRLIEQCIEAMRQLETTTA